MPPSRKSQRSRRSRRSVATMTKKSKRAAATKLKSKRRRNETKRGGCWLEDKIGYLIGYKVPEMNTANMKIELKDELDPKNEKDKKKKNEVRPRPRPRPGGPGGPRAAPRPGGPRAVPRRRLSRTQSAP